jgi:hypothetical protein
MKNKNKLTEKEQLTQENAFRFVEWVDNMCFTQDCDETGIWRSPSSRRKYKTQKLYNLFESFCSKGA